MRTKGVIAMVISGPESVSYLSGFRGGEGALVVSDDLLVLYTDFRYIEQAQTEAPEWSIRKWGRDAYTQLAADITKELRAGRIGFEAHIISVANLRRLQKGDLQREWYEMSGVVEEIRAVKVEQEVISIGKACSIADRALEAVLPYVVPGVTEAHVANELEYLMKKFGSETVSFETIVAFGSHSSLPHAVPGDRTAEAGDFVLIDFGAVVDGYHSDTTRTFVLGEASDKQREMYDATLEAQLAAVSGARPGMNGSEVHEIAREVLDRHGLAETFGHGLGHGVGLEVHERPIVSPAGKESLEPMNVFTIEPGVYIPGVGGVRIEDTIVMRDDGVEMLTSFPKELRVLPAKG